MHRQRTVRLAQTNQIQALVNYAKSLVEYDKDVGRTLRKLGARRRAEAVSTAQKLGLL